MDILNEKHKGEERSSSPLFIEKHIPKREPSDADGASRSDVRAEKAERFGADITPGRCAGVWGAARPPAAGGMPFPLLLQPVFPDLPV